MCFNVWAQLTVNKLKRIVYLEKKKRVWIAVHLVGISFSFFQLYLQTTQKQEEIGRRYQVGKQKQITMAFQRKAPKTIWWQNICFIRVISSTHWLCIVFRIEKNLNVSNSLTFINSQYIESKHIKDIFGQYTRTKIHLKIGLNFVNFNHVYLHPFLNLNTNGCLVKSFIKHISTGISENCLSTLKIFFWIQSYLQNNTTLFVNLKILCIFVALLTQWIDCKLSFWICMRYV